MYVIVFIVFFICPSLSLASNYENAGINSVLNNTVEINGNVITGQDLYEQFILNEIDPFVRSCTYSFVRGQVFQFMVMNLIKYQSLSKIIMLPNYYNKQVINIMNCVLNQSRSYILYFRGDILNASNFNIFLNSIVMDISWHQYLQYLLSLDVFVSNVGLKEYTDGLYRGYSFLNFIKSYVLFNTYAEVSLPITFDMSEKDINAIVLQSDYLRFKSKHLSQVKQEARFIFQNYQESISLNNVYYEQNMLLCHKIPIIINTFLSSLRSGEATSILFCNKGCAFFFLSKEEIVEKLFYSNDHLRFIVFDYFLCRYCNSLY